MLITISGPPGSGTTTASRLVADALGLERLPGGEVFRAMAAEAGMSVHEFGAHAEANHDIDRELDRRLLERARQGSCVIESRLAGWLVTRDGLDAVRAWVDCDEPVRAARVAQREGITEAQALAENRLRARLEHQRYLDIHGIEMTDLSIYDLILDSGKLGPKPIAEAIIGAGASAVPRALRGHCQLLDSTVGGAPLVACAVP